LPADNLRVVPFQIDVSQRELDDLRHRLASARWPDDSPDVDWARGVPAAYLKRLCRYWLMEYDWRAQEAQLNAFAQFRTLIDSQQLHFIHVRSPEPTAMPLLLCHGWPGSIAEFLKVILPLADPRSVGANPADAFHVVAPSLPGYGFSGPTREVGWNVPRIARAFATLMERLGYDSFGAQGGDWGSYIGREVGLIVPERVVGVHVNMLITPPPADEDALARLSQDDLARIDRATRFRGNGSGYLAIQRTRPMTLAYGLTDSPIGQLAWIVEKFKEWTDSTSVPEEAVDRDQMLTNVMIYWLTRTAGSSAALYYEHFSGRAPAPARSGVPLGVAVFAHDATLPVRWLAERDHNIVHWSEFPRGGHFPAMEEPETLVDDVRTFFRGLRTKSSPSLYR
jgi:epoxide hydrolase